MELSPEAKLLLAELVSATSRGRTMDILEMMRIVSRPDRAIAELCAAGLARRVSPRVYEATSADAVSHAG